MTAFGVHTTQYQAKLKALREALEGRLRQDRVRSA
jgi:hypothetical protein